jgi:methylenetetrahydrofolate reductase (NADPH)
MSTEGLTAARKAPKVSFEIFPPKTPGAEAQLWEALERLQPLSPAFVSCTYGAGGTTQHATRGAVERLLGTPMSPAAHLTCIGSSKDQIEAIVRDYWDLGVRHIVSLRGDAPKDAAQGSGGVLDSGYQNATELTAAITRIAPFELSVAAYPEKHPESGSLQHDVEVLKAKQDAGATRALTQFFFDVDSFYRYVDLARKAGVTIPIVPGIMPIASFKGIVRMAQSCQVSIPARLHALFDGLDDDAATRHLIAVHLAAEMSQALIDQGFGELHIYTLNRADLTYALCRILGLEDTSLGAVQ